MLWKFGARLQQFSMRTAGSMDPKKVFLRNRLGHQKKELLAYRSICISFRLLCYGGVQIYPSSK